MKFNYSLDDMHCFCAVARLGSFKQAARVLKMPLSTLSRRIRKLEQDLSLRLFHRDAHKVLLTNTGQCYYQRFYPLFTELGDIAKELHLNKHEARGVIRVAAPINMGSQVLGDKLGLFLQQYPHIQIDSILSNRLMNIDEQAIDVAFRVGEPGIQDWIAWRLKEVRFILCASPHRPEWHQIQHPEQLDQCDALLCQPVMKWDLINSRNEQLFSYQPEDRIRLLTNEIQLMTGAIRSGVGIGMVPDYYAQAFIEQGLLTRVLPEWSGHPRLLNMLYRDRDNLPHRVQLLISFMQEQFSTGR